MATDSNSAGTITTFVRYSPSEDNPIYLSGIIDRFTGEAVDYIRVSTWLDGSAMTDAKCDKVLYRKHTNGFYYKRVLKDGKVNMAWYLRDDGTDNLTRWNDFNNYVSQASRLFRLILFIPPTQNEYYSSGSVRFYGQRYTIENYGKHTCPADMKEPLWLFAGVDHADYEITGLGNWMEARPSENNLDGEGWLRIGFKTATDDWQNHESYRREHGIVGITIFGQNIENYYKQPVGTKVKSLRHTDYLSHGLMATMPMRIKNYYVSGFSGHPYYFYAPAIQQSDPILAPSRFNTSYGKVEGGLIYGCGGYGSCVFGADANHMTFENVNFYGAGCANFLDLSQSGTILANCSEQVGNGGYFMCSGGHWSLRDVYSETSSDTYNIFGGGGTAVGIFNKPSVGGGFVQQGTSVNGLATDVIHTSQLAFGEQNSGLGTAVRIKNEPTNGSTVAFRMNIEGAPFNSRGMIELLQPGSASASGRQFLKYAAVVLGADITTPYNEDYKIIVLQDRVIFKMDGFAPWPERYQKGDLLDNRSRSIYRDRPNTWRCTQAGVVGGLNHLQLGGPVATLVSSQRINLARASSLFQLGDNLLISENYYQIVDVSYAAYTTNKEVQSFTVSAPVVTPSTTLTIQFPVARFEAIGEGRGNYNQAAPYLRVEDSGWSFYDEALYKPLRWDGKQFRDAMGVLV